MSSSAGFDLCIKCNTGGKLLVCNEEDCPIVIHEKCMGCPVTCDDMGRFLCPYCVTRRDYEELKQARENVRLKRRALLEFIGVKVTDCDKEKEVSGDDKRRRKSPEQVEGEHVEHNDHDHKTSTDHVDGEKGVGATKSMDEVDVLTNRQGNTGEAMGLVHSPLVGVNDVGKTGEDQDDRRGDDRANLSGAPSVQEKTSEGEKDDSESSDKNENREKSHLKTASLIEDNDVLDVSLGGDEGDETSTNISKEHNPPSRKSKRIRLISSSEPRSSNVDFSGRSSPRIRKSPRKTRRTIAPSKVNSPRESPSPNADCSGRSSPIIRRTPRKTKKTNITSDVSQKASNSSGRRRLLWTEEEEEMIKKGVEKYSSEENKNIPWRNILEFGRHVFQSSRLPHHLKDKWRTMLAKENSTK